MSTTYYAISGIGYGRGDTPGKAVAAHREYAVAAKPSWVNMPNWQDRLDDPELAPTVFRAPEEATGFRLEGGSSVYWLGPDSSLIRKATDDDVVG